MIFAMVIKFAEVVISSDNLFHDTDTHGGFFYVIMGSFRRMGGLISRLYALTTLGLSLVMGAALQTGAIRESLLEVSYIPRESLALIIVLLTLIAIIGGTRKIEMITSIIIPMTTIIYIIITLGVIALNINEFDLMLKYVFNSAFKTESILGGSVSFLTLVPIREGFARGILSNEAGAGTSAIAHARNGVISPTTAGILGIFEVWFDTGLICMLTGFSILLSVPDITIFSGGMELVMYAVGNQFGAPGKYAVLFCVFAFAFATVICWYYYGSESFSQLFGKSKRAVFLPLFLVFVCL
jgi:AGCS family alanine or glycine:cation symporter